MSVTAVKADPIRIATFTTELDRKGPGLLVRDIERGNAQVQAVIADIIAVRPDVIVLHRFDWDAETRAGKTFQDRLAKAGWPMPHAFAPRPNTGAPTGQDINGNGRVNDGSDAQGFGHFRGNRALIILSRFPFGLDPKDFSSLLWADLPKSQTSDAPALAAVQRLSSVAHVIVPIETPKGSIDLFTFHATTPVFDGPDDRNGRRNADEILFWDTMGHLDQTNPFVLAGNFNLDPVDGEGKQAALHKILSHPNVQDPEPKSDGGTNAADADHTGDPGLDTVDWADDAPGNLRVSYALPSANLSIIDSGVHWPVGHTNAASRHRIVWVDVMLP